ncbi:hypothetical protein PCAR4_30059 [Paraburkholderia caribensis]|nr:hypothetical protein PCAR4_30059 [Paraburkholderia caribensis]
MSSECAGSGTRRWPHVCATSVPTFRMWLLKESMIVSSQPSRRNAWNLSPRCRMRSTPRRNSPTVTTERYRRCPPSLAVSKKACTPGLARLLLRISLITLVSIKYTRSPAIVSCVVAALEIGVIADVGHAHQPLREAELFGLKKRLRQDFPMLCFDAAPVSRGLFTQVLHQRIVQTSDQKICHFHSPQHV